MPTIDLSELPQPQVIEEPDYEVILAEVQEAVITAFPSEQQNAIRAAMALESEPLNIIAQVWSLRELLLIQRINEGAAACMLSHATASDLDNLAANLNTQRLIITEATDTTDEETESDTDLRLRAQSAFEGLSVAGPSGAYEYFALSASGLVRDATATSPSPAEVVVSILSTEGDGTASDSLLETVSDALNAEEVRPVADRLTVQSATIIPYSIQAEVWLYPGPEAEPIITAAQSALESWLSEQGNIGRDVARSAIMAALHVQGVQRVDLLSPAENIVVGTTQAAWCESYTVEIGGTDE